MRCWFFWGFWGLSSRKFWFCVWFLGYVGCCFFFGVSYVCLFLGRGYGRKEF